MTIWKYPLEKVQQQFIAAPKGARPLSIGFAPEGALCVWMKVDRRQKDCEHVEIIIAGTGHELEDTADHPLTFIGRVQDGPFVWHIFWHCK